MAESEERVNENDKNLAEDFGQMAQRGYEVSRPGGNGR